MRLLCPSCFQPFTVADAESGKTVACPSCSHSFEAPQSYVPSPIEPPSPPPAPPPLALPAPAAAAAAAIPPAPTTAAPAAAVITRDGNLHGCTHLASISLDRRVCEWTLLASSVLIVLLTFFSWVGCYPAGYGAYKQNAWQALFASMSVDPVSEKALKMEAPLQERLGSSWWLLPYFFFLFVGVALIWGDIATRTLKLKLPAVVQRFWQFRPALIAACAGLSLFFILAQSIAGFGLDLALHAKFEAEYRQEIAAAKTPEEIQRVEMLVAEQVGRFHLKTTTCLRLAILLHVLAVLAVAGETLLHQRGKRPPPRLGVMW